jgi:uncharacterized membrane protein
LSNTYKILLFLHIASVVVAFAPAVIGVLPGGDEGAAATLRRAGRVIYAPALILAGLFGILIVAIEGEDYGIEFSQTWISLSFLVWIAMNGVFHGMVLPTYTRGRSRRSSRWGRGTTSNEVDTGLAIITVLFVIMLYLMIWKPGL